MAKDKAVEPETLKATQQLMLAALNAVGAVSNRMGMPAAVFLLMLGAVYVFGSAATRDDFIRTLLFGHPKDDSTVQVELRVFACVIIAAMLATPLIRAWGARSENKEIARLRARVSELEGALLPAEDDGEDAPAEPPKRRSKKKSLPDDGKPSEPLVG